jgi:hypothetical protein
MQLANSWLTLTPSGFEPFGDRKSGSFAPGAPRSAR